VLARTDPNEQESVVLLDEHGRLPAPPQPASRRMHSTAPDAS
jgi:hypothetical protein